MTKSNLLDDTYRLLSKSLNVASRKHSLIAGNIANLDTVGYKPKDIDFRKVLEMEMQNGSEKLSRTDNMHFSTNNDESLIEAAVDEDGFYSDDPVNIDTEMSKLVENNVRYRTSVEMLKRKMTMIKFAISEGGR